MNKCSHKQNNSSDQKKSVDTLKYQQEILLDGLKMEKSKVLEHKGIIEDIQSKKSKDLEELQFQQVKKKSVTVESLPEVRKKTWIVKSSTLEVDSLITQSLRILDQASPSKGKVFDPSWSEQTKELSKKLWLPTKTDFVGLDSICSKKFSHSTEEQSWFSIEKIKKRPLQKKSLLTTSLPLSLLSQGESTDLGVVKSVKLSKKELTTKNLKFRIFPNQKWKEQFHSDSEVWRWYYNFVVDLHNEKKIEKTSHISIRETVKKYGYEYTKVGEDGEKDICIQKIVENKEDSFYNPPWFSQVHNRVIRGSIRKFSGNLKSAFSNKKNGNIKSFKMNFKSKKTGDYLSFEDKAFPSIYKKCNGFYGYRTKDRKRVSLNPATVAKEIGWSGCTFYHEEITDKYYLLFPVPIDYFPCNDHRLENQESVFTGKTISLDPGVRKFLVGYSPQGEILVVDRSKIISRLLLDIDKTEDRKEQLQKWAVIKNYIDDLHWKTIRYLVKNYDTIILGDIGIKSILKGNIPKITKRILSQYSFFKFKQRLAWVCSLTEKRLFLTHESFTSKMCCSCGCSNNVGSSEIYKCIDCDSVIDRDLNGAINILIKTITFLKL